MLLKKLFGILLYLGGGQWYQAQSGPANCLLLCSEYFALEKFTNTTTGEEQARKLQATLVRNYDPATDWLTDRGEL